LGGPHQGGGRGSTSSGENWGGGAPPRGETTRGPRFFRRWEVLVREKKKGEGGGFWRVVPGPKWRVLPGGKKKKKKTPWSPPRKGDGGRGGAALQSVPGGRGIFWWRAMGERRVGGEQDSWCHTRKTRVTSSVPPGKQKKKKHGGRGPLGDLSRGCICPYNRVLRGGVWGLEEGGHGFIRGVTVVESGKTPGGWKPGGAPRQGWGGGLPAEQQFRWVRIFRGDGGSSLHPLDGVGGPAGRFKKKKKL